MKYLSRKILRSMWENRRSYLACIFVIAIGIMMYITMSNLVDNMSYAVESFYEDMRFADLFAKVSAMPRSSAEALSSIEGIEVVAPRLVIDVRANNDKVDKVITLRLIGIHPDIGSPLNDIKIEGDPVSGLEDILLDPSFFAAHQYRLGDSIEVIINGTSTSFHIRGTVQSPEYVYAIPDMSTIYPDPESFSIAYVHHSTLENLSGNLGYVNDISFRLTPGLPFRDVKDSLENALRPYGLLSLYEREDQLSYSLTDMEITAIGAFSKIAPVLFLGIATVILYIMLQRLVEQERVTIGTLKAFGFSDASILSCYLLYGAVTGLLGGIMGGLYGLPLAGFYFNMMITFFNLPGIETQISLAYVLNGLLLSVVVSTLAALWGVSNILSLKPAEAMRPPAPATISESWLDRLALVKRLFTSRGLMSLRYIRRSGLRSSFIVVSIALSYALMTVIFSLNLMIDQMIFDQFEKAQIYQFQAVLKNPSDVNSALNAISSMEGVTAAEAIFELPVTLSHQHMRKGVQITGIPADAQLYRILDEEYRRYAPPSEGLILNRNLADKLGVSSGSSLRLESPLLDEEIQVSVARVINQNFGSGCYMELQALTTLIGSAPQASMLVFNADSAQNAAIRDRLLSARNIATVEDKANLVASYHELLDTFGFIFAFLGLMAILISFAIVYNISRVSLSERSRELATMRVLGLSIEETNEIIAFEHWLLCVLAILLGLPLALLLRQALSGAFPSDLFIIPTATPPRAFVLAALGCLASIALANRSVAKAISVFDLVDVLKERE